jgi:hypothetical protein
LAVLLDQVEEEFGQRADNVARRRAEVNGHLPARRVVSAAASVKRHGEVPPDDAER